PDTHLALGISVRVRNELSEEFPIRIGDRQGDVASPLLFNIVIDAIMRKAFEGRCGVQYDVNNFLTDLMLATDILCQIACTTQSYGLRINADKTKVMTTDGSQANVHLNGIQIEQVQEFKYLGSLVQEKKMPAITKELKVKKSISILFFFQSS
uniref:Reverse transcriptase domain-containing protein n=1 Tax=Scleropages formosus TaxID=113540 RepID=A0A8C9WF11_SCLFO